MSKEQSKAKNEKELMAEAGWVPAPVAAEAVGVQLSTLHRRIQGGKLVGQEVGGRWYVQALSLLADYQKTPLEGRVRAAIAACGAVIKR